jgi:cobalt-zinc-cadmium efflux system membrane fusion protein
MLGLSTEELAQLATALPAEDDAPKEGHGCTDPNCTDCQADEQTSPLAAPLNRTRLGWYEIKAPFDGFIVQKHIALGERVGEDADVFTIVDTGSVWVNFSVYTKDLPAVHPGQAVVLQADHSGFQARSEIAMVTPFVEQSTRSATARVVLDNGDRRWVPGTFVTGHIRRSQEELPLVVPRDAVQRIEDRDVLFVEHEGAFEMMPVTLGRTDRTSVEITGGLKPGERYVAEGAFQLKATVITSNLDAHAGHGH